MKLKIVFHLGAILQKKANFEAAENWKYVNRV